MKEGEQIHLIGVKKGDKSSFRWVYNHYHASVFRFCLHFIRDEALTKEATADVFITLWQKRNIISTSTSIAPFLFKVAKDISYNYLKKIARNDRLKSSYIDHYPVMESKDGESLFIEQENLEALQHLTDQLPPKRKMIFQMRYYEGLNNKEIAEQLEISINTVREQLAKARQFLKEKKGLNMTVLLTLTSVLWP